MSLTEYRRKRRFDQTREPEPGKRAPAGRRPIFVVQLHHASRRHYDFRLQVGDALKSWAVPKGPSYDPKVKRMAVEVEDHPLDYAGFEGEIPKGHYGGGHVAQFDHGVWSSEGDVEAQLAKGHLRFELFGDKLKGGWHLVRSGKPARQPQWLLFKDDDAYAGSLEADDLLAGVTAPPAADAARAGRGKAHKLRRERVETARPKRRRDWASRAAKLPGARKAKPPTAAFEPQLARLGDTPPEGEQWLHEIKWDGYRILATMAKGEAQLWSRNALPWTAKLPEIAAAVEALGPMSLALDGELIAGQGRKEDFNLLQSTLSGERPGKLVLALFDLLHVDGIDISAAPLRARKALLQEILEHAGSPHLAFSSHIEADGAGAYALAGEQHFEGIISKRADRPYHPGRSDDWRKTKQLASDEFAVVGYTAPRGSRQGFGSLLLAKPDAEHGWRYVGRVGTGFTDAMLAQISERIGKAGGAKPTAHVGTTDTDLRHAKWFAPRFVVEVYYRGIGRQSLLRQPSLKAVREDKRVGELRDSDRAPAKQAPAKQPAATARGRKQPAAPELPALSSPSKVLYPEDGITKQQVWDYYRAVMPWLLPEIADRPLSIIRCPAGTGRACFFQKHHTAGLERVDAVRLKEEGGHAGQYLVVRDEASVMELVQFNALEFHPWGSHAEQPGRADRVVFDLDPGPDVPFAEVKRAAMDIRRHLASLELESFLRVSGGKGLHIVVPLNPGCEWRLVKRFAQGFAEALAQSAPDRFVASASKRLRGGRIFVDYLRNARGATAVASYSLRARPGAPVAMPLAWTQLSRLARADAFPLAAALASLRRRRKDPWEGIDTVRQDLSRWEG
ncbi:ATP-dependent DNA ligase [Stenotrophomonas panacihumi]|uniref:DNA ligase (ATP) n=1 Tax=Stenotrophomonas panacihumi TaxID=676599 RepID=A0A0R0AMC2_9GAMM|nr:DNA ligase D [Stenotrophomonas panacihumi]KRG42842.1 ATP-dependent DNA ligase [Stenotrophomonas panacihumi]PTN55605.1 DNA ligase D [Stenotrophomonas panacihumi]